MLAAESSSLKNMMNLASAATGDAMMIKLVQKAKQADLYYRQEILEYGSHPREEWEKQKIAEASDDLHKAKNKAADYFIERYASYFLPSERIFALAQFLEEDFLLEADLLKLFPNLYKRLGIGCECPQEEREAFDYIDKIQNVFGNHVPVYLLIDYLGYKGSAMGENFPLKMYEIASNYIKKRKNYHSAVTLGGRNDLIIELRNEYKYLELKSDKEYEDADNFRSSSWRRIRAEETMAKSHEVYLKIKNLFFKTYDNYFSPLEIDNALTYFIESNSIEVFLPNSIYYNSFSEEARVYAYLEKMYPIFKLNTPIIFLVKYLGYDYKFGDFDSIDTIRKIESFVENYKNKIYCQNV